MTGILTRVQRSLLSDGPAIYLAMLHWPCGSISNVLPAGQTRPRCWPTRFISTSARAAASRRQLRELFRRGRISLLIGLAFLAGSLTLSDITGNVSGGSFAALLREGFIIGGWVAMWRPLEVFLYDWWPIRGEIRLLDRLAAMPVQIEYNQALSDDAWKSDWPAVPSGARSDSEIRRLSK